jgi:hypothetical protein
VAGYVIAKIIDYLYAATYPVERQVAILCDAKHCIKAMAEILLFMHNALTVNPIIF